MDAARMVKSPTLLGETEFEIATLKGVRQIVVGVEPLSPEAEAAGISRADIECRMRTRLNEAGIPSRSGDEFDGAPESLLVMILTVGCVLDRGPGLYVICSSLHFRQHVRLVRQPDHRTYAVTWMNVATGAIAGPPREACMEQVDERIEAFVRAYRQANPAPLP